MIDVDMSVLSHLKEELVWATDKRVHGISNYNENSKSTKELKENKE